MRIRNESSSIGWYPEDFKLSQSEIAKRLGLTRRQVQVIEARALRKLYRSAKASKIIKEMMGIQ